MTALETVIAVMVCVPVTWVSMGLTVAMLLAPTHAPPTVFATTQLVSVLLSGEDQTVQSASARPTVLVLGSVWMVSASVLRAGWVTIVLSVFVSEIALSKEFANRTEHVPVMTGTTARTARSSTVLSIAAGTEHATLRRASVSAILNLTAYLARVMRVPMVAPAAGNASWRQDDASASRIMRALTAPRSVAPQTVTIMVSVLMAIATAIRVSLALTAVTDNAQTSARIMVFVRTVSAFASTPSRVSRVPNASASQDAASTATALMANVSAKMVMRDLPATSRLA